MLRFLDILSFLAGWGYAFVFFRLLCDFVPVRSSWLLRIPGFYCCAVFSWTIVYSNDLPSLLIPLLGFCVYISLFHRGKWTEKLTAVLIFYPAVIAINYLMQDMGSRLFFAITGAPDPSEGWSYETQLISTAIHLAFLVVQLLFWLCAWMLLRKYLKQITSNLTTRMWLILDMLVLAAFVAIFSIIYFLPRGIAVVYPVCAASVFSSFGCIYFAAYICNSIQTACYAQELETKQAYVQDRLKEEERVRSIYHDMKNHLLILEAQIESLNRPEQILQKQSMSSDGQTACLRGQSMPSDGQTACLQEQSMSSDGRSVSAQEIRRSVQSLQEQIEAYENYIHTGNDYLDVILRDKSRLAREKQIDFHAAIQFEEGGFVEPLDISAIWGNALDNAIEASEKLPESMRLITAKASRIHDLLVIVVENNRKLEALTYGKTDKKDSFLHGFGIANIQRTAEKYGGQCIVRPQEGKFVLKIVLPIPT